MELNENVVEEIEKYSRRIPSVLRSSFERIQTKNKIKNADEIIGWLVEQYCANFLHENEFEFPPGHRKLLTSIGVVVRNTIEKESESFFNVNGINESEITCPTIPTPLGTIHYDYLEGRFPQSKSKQANACATSQVSTQSTDPVNADSAKINELAKELESGLLLAMRKKIDIMTSSDEKEFLAKCSLATNDLKPDTVKVDIKSLTSVLKERRLIVLEHNVPNNHGKSTISGIITCFCSSLGQAYSLRVTFKFKSHTEDTIRNYISCAQGSDMNAVQEHFQTCWDLYSFTRHHNMIHLKRLREKKRVVHADSIVNCKY